MAIMHVAGHKRKRILLYALSTCVWCRKTKQLLNELGVAYDYLDVDLLEGAERKQAEEDIEKWNSNRSFPLLLIEEKEVIIGFDEEKIRKALGF